MARPCGLLALFAAFAACVQGQAPNDATSLRGSSSGNGGAFVGQVLLNVSSKAPFPVTLANCDANVSLPAFEIYDTRVSMSQGFFFWVVPEGTPWDCENGCPECFYVALGLEQGGGLLARIGYQTDESEDQWDGFEYDKDGNLINVTSNSDDEQEPNGAITGMELIVTRTEDGARESSACGDNSCSPDWEQDHAVAWDSTIDLIIQGSTETGTQLSSSSKLIFASARPHHMRYHRRYPGYRHRRMYRPPVWRRPVWTYPLYPRYYCLYCSIYCPFMCR